MAVTYIIVYTQIGFYTHQYTPNLTSLKHLVMLNTFISDSRSAPLGEKHLLNKKS